MLVLNENDLKIISGGSCNCYCNDNRGGSSFQGNVDTSYQCHQECASQGLNFGGCN